MEESILAARTRLDRANEKAEDAMEAWAQERSTEAWWEFVRADKEAYRASEYLKALVDRAHEALRNRHFA